MATTDPSPPTGLSYKALAASGIVKTGEGDCHLLWITASSSMTIKLWDNTAASGTVIANTTAVNAGEQYDAPAHFNTGLYVEIVAGTGSLTVFFV